MNLGAKLSLEFSYPTQYAEAAVQDFVKISLVLIPPLKFIKPNIKPNTQFYGSGLPWKYQQSRRQGKGSLILRN